MRLRRFKERNRTMVKIATVCMGSDPRDKAANRNKMIA